jgi:thiopeptide-type bacteriocin biosynthesis protein
VSLQASGFFCLRTHLLPFETLLQWSGDRERLRAIVTHPAIREAIFIASPGLEEVIDLWISEPDGDRGRRAERALVKYVARLASRPTPFGLFASVSTGRIEGDTRLVVSGITEVSRHTRLDNEFLFSLAHALHRDPGVRGAIRYRPNDSLHFLAGHGRYAEARPAKSGHTFHLVSVEETPALRATLARAETPGGATVAELAAPLVDRRHSRADADRFIEELIESQVLVSDLAVQVTGPEPGRALADRLTAIGSQSAVATTLTSALQAIDQLDAAGLGNSPAHYRAIAASLEATPVKPELPRLFQVDLVRPDGGTLGEAVVQEIRRGVELLHRITPPATDPLARFTQALNERYEGREVPLLEALDDEVGVGSALWPASDPSPLLKDLPLGSGEPERILWGRREEYLLRRLSQLTSEGKDEWLLSPADLEVLTTPSPLPLPDAISASVTLAARDEAAVTRGEFELHLDHAGGPSGARLLGRFCHSDSRLHAAVVDHLRVEESADPEAVYAELVHLSEGRLGNILLRPVLREYEITYLGASGAAIDRQIPASDLVLRTNRGRLELWSRRLGRRVIPRLTTAHNYALGLPPYRFLALLQTQGCVPWVSWAWGPMRSALFLPRVRHGRLILSLAQWQVEKGELRALLPGPEAQRFEAVQAWRARRRLPRWVCLAEGDNRLPIDLDNRMLVDCLLHEIGDREGALLEELWPGEDRLLARGPEGSYRHELLVPFTVKPGQESRPTAPARARSAEAGITRRFVSGTEWLYVKLYTSQAEADEILAGTIGPLSRRWLAKGAIRRWFFIRYSDPEFHLRWRLEGDPNTLTRRVWPAIQKAVAGLLQQGKLWRVQLDTYEREVERYGGPDAIALAEQLFHADSEAVLDLSGMLEPGDAGLDERWRLALAGADRLLQDLGLTLEERLQLARDGARHYGSVAEPSSDLRHLLTARYRELRGGLEPLLNPATNGDHPLAPGFEVLAERSARSVEPVAELRRLAEAGRLVASLTAIAGSLVHMHFNRLLRGAPNAHESVIYDFMRRLYESRLARQR